MKPAYAFRILLVLLNVAAVSRLNAQSTLSCRSCHSSQQAIWLNGKHANTQSDIAGELAANWAGQTADSVISGSNAENCVGCHSPSSVAKLGGLTETQVMAHFFTTTDNKYTDSTRSTDTIEWPQVACVSCHNVPGNHPTTMPTFGVFNSTTKQYDPVSTQSQVCGRCHGTLKFAETDHQVYDAWQMSRHGRQGQNDLATELASSWAGQPADSVILGTQAENCIACHAPTSTNPTVGIKEVQALNRFFTLKNGLFDSTTTVADTAHWENVSCSTCHNPHKPDTLACYNSTTGKYEYFVNANELCGQCHGNLRFPDTDHRSYNISMGTGGIGVADQVTMPGASCVDCHMHRSDVDGSNSRMYGGHTWSTIVQESGTTATVSCAKCHSAMTADQATSYIQTCNDEYAHLDSVAQANVTAASNVTIGASDTMRQQYLTEAQHNLEYAEMDESGGVHNHKYLVALLNDAIQKSSVVTGIVEEPLIEIPREFRLYQNYPNPFNPSSIIRYDVPKSGFVKLSVFDLAGREIRTLVNQWQAAGSYSVTLSANSMASGVYFYRLTTASITQTRKMVLIR
jgi:formate-dependent nitrite reductase cytochrome c552 subunit